MTPEALGLDVEAFRATWPASHMTFKQLNQVLQRSSPSGVGMAFVWKPMRMHASEVFAKPFGVYGMSARWIHPDNRAVNRHDDDGSGDFDSNYEHAVVWIAGRKALFWMDVEIAEEGDLVPSLPSHIPTFLPFLLLSSPYLPSFASRMTWTPGLITFTTTLGCCFLRRTT